MTVSGCKNLREMVIRNDKIETLSLWENRNLKSVRFEQCRNLGHLQIAWCARFTDQDFDRIFKYFGTFHNNVKVLEIKGMPKVKTLDLRLLPNLVAVSIDKCLMLRELTIAALDLEVLYLTGVKFLQRMSLSARRIKTFHTSDLPRLSSLVLSQIEYFNMPFFDRIIKCAPNLSSLDLSNIQSISPNARSATQYCGKHYLPKLQSILLPQ